MSDQDGKMIPELATANSDKPTFYPYSVKINKCGGSCSNINDTSQSI